MKTSEKIRYGSYLLLKGWDLPFLEKPRANLVRALVDSKCENLVVQSNVIIHGFENLEIGQDVSLNHGCFISAYGGLKIGSFVSIGHNTSIITSDHSFAADDKPIKYQPVIKKPVVLNDNIWVGANVTILGGVTIAEGTIIAAGAVVNKSVVDKNSVVGGVPAKHIKFYSE